MGIRKKEHVIGIDRWSEPDHGFRKLAKPDIVWLLPETQDSPHVFPPPLFLSPPMNLASYVVVVIIVVVIVTILSTTTMHTVRARILRVRVVCIRPSISFNRVSKGTAIRDGALTEVSQR